MKPAVRSVCQMSGTKQWQYGIYTTIRVLALCIGDWVPSGL